MWECVNVCVNVCVSMCASVVVIVYLCEGIIYYTKTSNFKINVLMNGKIVLSNYYVCKLFISL